MLTLVAPNFVNKLFFSMPLWRSVAPDKNARREYPTPAHAPGFLTKKRRFDRASVIIKSLLNIIKHDPILTEAQSERRFVFHP